MEANYASTLQAMAMKDDEIGRILQSQTDDFARWQGDVHRQLREGSPPNDNEDRVLQFLEFPSFESPSALNVYNDKKQQEYYITQTKDNQTVRAPLAKEEFQRHYLRLCSQSLPSLLPATDCGLDGALYELAVGNTWLGWHLNWWEELPKEWGELKNAIAEMIAFLRASLTQGNPI